MLGMKSLCPGASSNVIFFVSVVNMCTPTSMVMPLKYKTAPELNFIDIHTSRETLSNCCNIYVPGPAGVQATVLAIFNNKNTALFVVSLRLEFVYITLLVKIFITQL